jgi:L-ascorbate metabolism protein UlaG (beta-lactamase superfamily)
MFYRSVTRRRFIGTSTAASVLFGLQLGHPAYAADSKGRRKMKPVDFLYTPDFEPDSAPGKDEISIKWFGCAAYRIEYGGEVLWIDPYFSRHSLFEMGFGYIEPKPREIDPCMDRADYIAIGHSHYDHAADLPYIVPKTGAIVYGDKSVGNLFIACDLPRDNFQEISAGASVEAGPFKITFIRSAHGKLLGRIPSNYDISPDLKPPLRTKHFGSGVVFNIIVEANGYKIYHQGSGGIVEETLQGCRADLAIIGISSRKGAPRLVYRVVKELQPKVVMPTHYDMFFSPLRRGFYQIPGLKFGQVVRETKEASKKSDLITLPLLGEYRVKTG